jgi:hypothetical protein
MTPERWEAIDRVWQAVLARPEDERAAAIVELSQGDDALRHDVESLLAHLAGASAAGFGHAPLEVPVPPAALVGRSIGSYAVRSVLGVGGMGEVYRAHDPTLGREVALKILPEPWLSHPGRRARFEREARLLASLNHPNVGAIYGVLEGDPSMPGQDVRALVLELVEGDTLAERLARQADDDGASRGLPIDEAVAIARQLTAALEAAHERGIVHRDLKPGNIKITADGRVKVLDFGLARAVGDADSGVETPSGRPPDLSATRAGLLIGTATYMSPEQARGRPVDKRTDIWAFGCVLYEMLAGVRAFDGGDIAETLANVIRAEPDWSRLPRHTPPRLRRCVQRCLQKDPDQRIRDIADARLAMEGAFDASVRVRDGWIQRSARWLVTHGGWAAAALIAVAAAVIVVVVVLRRDATDAPAVRAQTDGPPAISARAAERGDLPGPRAETEAPSGLRAPDADVADTPAAPAPAVPPKVVRSIVFSPAPGLAGGSSTAATIQEAIDRAGQNPNARVLIPPGTYAETLRITKAMLIEGISPGNGTVIIAPPDTPQSVIEIATTEPVTLSGLTVRVPGRFGIRGSGGVNLTVRQSVITAVNPAVGEPMTLLAVSNDGNAPGVRANVAVRDSWLDGTVTTATQRGTRPEVVPLALAGDVDGEIIGNTIRRSGIECLRVATRSDLGGMTNVNITDNTIDECHPVRDGAAVMVGIPSVLKFTPDQRITATGKVNIVDNRIRNSSKDCLNAAIAFDVFGGRIERNTIEGFVQPCAERTARNAPAAIFIGLLGRNMPQVPPVVPTVRFNDIRGNAHAGLAIASNQTIEIDASCNYWGSERGPSGIGPGDGDAIVVEAGGVPPVFVPFAKSPLAKAPPGGC